MLVREPGNADAQAMLEAAGKRRVVP